jgi:proteasome accessory factor C
MSEARARLQRIMRILPLFESRTEICSADLERITKIPIQTVIDDLRALTSRHGDPGGFVEAVGIEIHPDRISIRASHFLRPLRLTDAEVCALELGMALLAQSRPLDEQSVIERARAKVHRLLSVAFSQSAHCDFYSEIPLPRDRSIAETLRQGCQERRAVVIEYHAAGAESSSERLVHPYAVVATHGTWFVVAHCTRAGAMRLFRADRIAKARLTEQAFQVPADLSAIVDLYRKPYLGDRGPKLVIRYSARIAAWIAEREKAQLDSDGTVTVAHPLGEDAWAVRHVLQYAGEAEVLAPERIRRAVLQRLQKMHEATRLLGRSGSGRARRGTPRLRLPKV